MHLLLWQIDSLGISLRSSRILCCGAAWTFKLSSDKSIPRAHYVSDHRSEIKQTLFVSPSPLLSPCKLFFNLVFFTFKYLTLLTPPVPSHHDPPTHTHTHISFCFFWYKAFTVHFGVISHQILLFSVSCSGRLAALFTGFLLLPCTTGLAAWLERENVHCALCEIIFVHVDVRDLFVLCVHTVKCNITSRGIFRPTFHPHQHTLGAPYEQR